MRKYILLFLFVSSYTLGYSQIVRGIILDSKTKTPISFASVYFKSTLAATISDEKGYFELDRSKYPSMPIIVSSIGYYSFTLADFSTTQPIQIFLKSKDYELNETVIKSKSLVKDRMRYMKKFKEEFLGKNENARKCRILNDSDITFDYYANKDTLRAFALKPILIENEALGYTVTSYLDKFEYSRKSKKVDFIGNVVFKEYPANKKKQMEYAKNRKNAYLGSRMHFFRSLSGNDSIVDGFKVANSNYESLLIKDLVAGKKIMNLSYYYLHLKDIVVQDSLENRYLSYPTGLRIIYPEEKRRTYISFLKKYVFFDKTGYFDSLGIEWDGAMGEQRIADWLPYEYIIE
jgi:hypothetical protein